MKNILLFLFLSFSLGCQKSDLLGGNGSLDIGSEDSSSSEIGNGNSSCGIMAQNECEMLKVVNQYRASQSIAPLKVLNKCVTFARDHAKDMNDRSYFSHDSPTETFIARLSRYSIGYPAGENIAMGSSDVNTIFNLWKNSPGHNANMLNSSYRSLGVGYYNGYWVQCFSGEVQN